MNISLIIPAYNEAEHLPHIFAAIPPTVKEVIVVDDGSSDQTADIARSNNAIVVQHSQNQGKGRAMVSGINAASGDVVVFMDADMQHHPEDIERLVASLDDGSADMVIGVRTLGSRGEMPPQRRLTNFLGNLLVFLRIGEWISDTQSGFRAVKKDFLDKMVFKSKRYEIEIEMLVWAHKLDMRIREEPIKVKYAGEKSHWKVRNLFRVFKILH
ncbi:MAG: glycosyltransferase family 2 protein [Theionarchaea archaeon]|nr:glycosyltransferase family 2 protein [Theionarchaea archaeon]MBU6999259.1 glycosyltransferase family 2 protein [Theionarchaea archaeon]MBU7019616.1 glycosyltransferase family 2 protein [Theionarchaea archaeon]MBU7033795.1 glycosyltransferase family 2 protein [Theionarchaea archaeon]MBU7040205.1 glycosyltransferase family 2 protein [Theionarchaea archaeon]